MSTIGYNLRKLRKKYGMTQKGLAARARITQGTLSLYESDQIRPKIQVLSRLADAFGVSVGFIDQSISVTKPPAAKAPDDDALAVIADVWDRLSPADRVRLSAMALEMVEKNHSLSQPADGTNGNV